jgi:predicted Zn-dependent protease
MKNPEIVGNSSHAESLYREALAKSPHDAWLTAGLVRSLRPQQKVEDAASTSSAVLSLSPNSVPLLTASAEVELPPRQDSRGCRRRRSSLKNRPLQSARVPHPGPHPSP